MDVLLKNIRAIIHILDKTTDDTELTIIIDSLNSLDMNAKIHIGTSSIMDEDDYEVEDEYLEVVLSDDVYFVVSKYFEDCYDVSRYNKRYDGGYTIRYIDNNDRAIYKRYHNDDIWVGNDHDHHYIHPKELTEEETRLIDILNSTMPRRWYRWQYNDPRTPL